MKNLITPNTTLALVLLAAMAAVALRAADRRPEPRRASGAGSAPFTVRTPGPPGWPVPLSRCRAYFTSCTPMGAMLLARSATSSTGRPKATSQPQPGLLILGLVPDQPAPGAATDRVHKAIYRLPPAAELSQPGCLTRGPRHPASRRWRAHAAGHCHERSGLAGVLCCWWRRTSGPGPCCWNGWIRRGRWPPCRWPKPIIMRAG